MMLLALAAASDVGDDDSNEAKIVVCWCCVH